MFYYAGVLGARSKEKYGRPGGDPVKRGRPEQRARIVLFLPEAMTAGYIRTRHNFRTYYFLWSADCAVARGSSATKASTGRVETRMSEDYSLDTLARSLECDEHGLRASLTATCHLAF